MKGIKLWLDFHKQACRHSFSYLKKEPIVTGMTIFILAILLMLSSLFWILAGALHSATIHWQSNKQISLYLTHPSSPDDESDLMAKVLATSGVAEAKLTTSMEAIKILQEQPGMLDILSYLPENPLPAVIDVKTSADISTEESLENLYRILKAYPHVADAKLDLEWINRIFLFLGFLTKLLNILIALFAVALILIVMNTLRLIINDRSEEITVLKFIGADYPFIMRPYLYSGIWYGLFSSMLAILFVAVLLLSLQTGINNLLITYNINYTLANLPIHKILVLTLLSMFLGWFGARISVRNHLLKKFSA